MAENNSIIYRLTQNDFYAFNKYINYRQMRVFLIPYLIIFLFFVIPPVITWTAKSAIEIRNHTFIFGAIGLIGFVMLNYIIKSRSRKIFRLNPEIQKEKTLNINNECIEIITGDANAKLLWNEIVKISFTGRYIYLMLSKVKGIILPKILLDDNIVNIIKSKKNRSVKN